MEENTRVNPKTMDDTLVLESDWQISHNTNFVGDLMEEFGPDMILDIPAVSDYYLKKINESKPFDTIIIEAEHVEFNSLYIKHPLKIVGKGSTTVVVHGQIHIDFEIQEMERYKRRYKVPGYNEYIVNLENVYIEITPNRVTFENMKIVWKLKKKFAIQDTVSIFFGNL